MHPGASAESLRTRPIWELTITMTPGLRKLTFTAHVTSSVGWIGAVFVFLALAVIGSTSPDERAVRGAYLLLAPAAWFVLVPLGHASLLRTEGSREVR